MSQLQYLTINFLKGGTWYLSPSPRMSNLSYDDLKNFHWMQKTIAFLKGMDERDDFKEKRLGSCDKKVTLNKQAACKIMEPQEKIVLGFILEGKHTRHISAIMGIPTKKVNQLRKSILEKINK